MPPQSCRDVQYAFFHVECVPTIDRPRFLCKSCFRIHESCYCRVGVLFLQSVLNPKQRDLLNMLFHGINHMSGQFVCIRKKNPEGWWEGELQVHTHARTHTHTHRLTHTHKHTHTHTHTPTHTHTQQQERE